MSGTEIVFILECSSDIRVIHMNLSSMWEFIWTWNKHRISLKYWTSNTRHLSVEASTPTDMTAPHRISVLVIQLEHNLTDLLCLSGEPRRFQRRHYPSSSKKESQLELLRVDCRFRWCKAVDILLAEPRRTSTSSFAGNSVVIFRINFKCWDDHQTNNPNAQLPVLNLVC